MGRRERGRPVCREVITSSPEGTRELGAWLAPRLAPGDKLLLMGSLGAGKTCFVQGLAVGLGVDPDRRVTSQSFTLLGIYPGRVPLFHFDAYRLADPRQLLRWDEDALLGEAGIAAVEWGGGLRRLLPEPVLSVRFRILSEQDRSIMFYSRAARFEPVVREIGGEN